jgi:uncharacterized membrane protein YkvA (DUF1232 family)
VSIGTDRRTRASEARRHEQRATADAELPERPRTGARRTVLSTIKQLPNYVRLLYGLLTDHRVSRIDKLLVAGAIAYIISPIDLVPDFIPFLGQVDDIFLLMLALQRLVENAGRGVVISHWDGDGDELENLNLNRVLLAAAFFLPRGLRRRLRRAGRLTQALYIARG